MNGRELHTYNDGTNIITYNYDLDGIRTSKIFNGVETKYYLEGNNIIFEDRNGTMIYYIYNGNDVLGFVYNNNTYYYHKNIFGDIIGILDSNHNEIVTYTYDSWGRIINTTDTSNINLSEINPFRYRSYYYDNETQLYYLNSRYYNPEWGRFINADSIVCANRDIISCNIFQYVSNNPINSIDENGKNLFKDGLIKTVARHMWNTSTKILKKVGMNYSAELLKHSVSQSKPVDLRYDSSSNLSKKISKDSDFKNKMKEITKTADRNGNINYGPSTEGYTSLKFETNKDLFGALHNVSIEVSGNVNDGYLNVLLTDNYDFHYVKDYGNSMFSFFAITGNNLAWFDQKCGLIKNYKIYIEINYEI